MSNPFLLDMTIKLKEKQNEFKRVKEQISLLEEYERDRANSRQSRRSNPARVYKTPPKEVDEEVKPTKRRNTDNPKPKPPQSNPLAVQFKPRVQTFQDNLTRMILGCR
jgi:hypothetical protein